MANAKEIVLITGASSGFGAFTARALARAGHTVYASMLDIHGCNAAQVETMREFAAEHQVDLRTVELDRAGRPTLHAAAREAPHIKSISTADLFHHP